MKTQDAEVNKNTFISTYVEHKIILNYTYNFFYVLSYLEYLKRKQLFQTLLATFSIFEQLKNNVNCSGH